jgi:hypothetical protein
VEPLTAAERMRAYRARKRAAGFKKAGGWIAAPASAAEHFSDHRLRDARSLALHCKIAAKIAADPELMVVARRNLDRWTASAGTAVPRHLAEWRRILRRPWPEIASIITGFDQDAIRLRQSSPFAGVLTPEERRRIYEAFRA